MNITATLKNAVSIEHDGKTVNIRGNIYDDTRGRFRDGEAIFTGRIQEELPGNIFRTLHSTFKVEFAPKV